MKKKKVKEIGITALYERLSRDDDGDGDSNSIVHQKQMLETYAKEHGFINLHHYTDDGWSGASFDRPAWNELVSGVKDGKITTVIVKAGLGVTIFKSASLQIFSFEKKKFVLLPLVTASTVTISRATNLHRS